MVDEIVGSDLDVGSRETGSQFVRFNREYFGFIVGFPNGEIELASPSALSVLHEHVTPDELRPHLLESLNVRDGFYLETPPLLWLELTRKCDLSCPHCYINAGNSRPDEMNTRRWLALLDEIADMGVWAVAFTGGEPTLHKDFVEIVRHARNRKILVGIATHGMFLTDELLDSLPKEGVIISVSIDDLHLRRRNTQALSSPAMDAILRSQRHGFLTNIMTNTNRSNIHQLGGMMDWAENHGVSVRSVPFSPIGRGKQRRDLENTVEDVETAAKFWVRECEWEHEYHRRAGLCVGVIFNYGLTLSYMTRRCSSGRFLAYIASDGTVYPCTMCASEEIFAAGSVQDRDFASVWRDEWEIRSYSWDNFAQTCAGCPINDERYFCSSRCPAMSHARHNTYFDCGASPFEIESTIRRSALLDTAQAGNSQGFRSARSNTDGNGTR
ncbi:radical SAM protein [Nocardia gipuzkoensis]